MDRGVNEVPTPQGPQQELEMGNPDIENQIGDHGMASTSTEPLQATTERNNIEYPSIHLATSFENWLSINRKYQSHVDYMARWLGLDRELYFQHMRQQEDQILGHYDHNQYSEIDTVIEVCMFGSCFQVLAILLLQNLRFETRILKGDATGDPERSKHYSHLRKVMEDRIETKKEMLCLGLQIPWLAVQAVVSYSDLNSELSGRTTIDELAISCFDYFYPRANESKVDSGKAPSGGFKHLLHIFHWTRTPKDKWLVETDPYAAARPLISFADFFISNATQLLESSISFKKHGSGTDVICEVKRLSGLMQITPLHISTYSSIIFRELVAFERKYVKCGLPVTSYLACMTRLLLNKEDVKLMQQNSIVEHIREKDVSDFVQDMVDCLLDIDAHVPDDLRQLSEKVMEHHERDANRWYADFKRQFRSNRWIVISIIGAIALFILTTLQTIYTVLGYYHQH